MGIAAMSEIKSNAISRWIRKTDDVKADTRSLTDAVTSSRMGLVEMCLADYRRKPILGMGFQVAAYTQTRTSSIFSSPIEKGVLPIMVLGETGIIGLMIFVLFLVSFQSAGAKRGLFVAVAMMWVLIGINMGEATFFSPGGAGGIEWVLCIVGGYLIDGCRRCMSSNKIQFEWDISLSEK